MYVIIIIIQIYIEKEYSSLELNIMHKFYIFYSPVVVVDVEMTWC